jgi:subtilisin family serine protease
VRRIYWFLAVFLLFSWPANAESRRIIALVETGLNPAPEVLPYLCESGSRDFTGTDMKDRIGHGTVIAKLAVEGLDPRKVCFVVLKWANQGGGSPEHVLQAIKYAIGIGASIINLSLGGESWSTDEHRALEVALAQHIHVVVAAGNDGLNMSRVCPYYPACYRFKSPYFHVVGSYDGDVREEWSNWGTPITDRACGISAGLRGTSLSAARVTNRIARSLQ